MYGTVFQSMENGNSHNSVPFSQGRTLLPLLSNQSHDPSIYLCIKIAHKLLNETFIKRQSFTNVEFSTTVSAGIKPHKKD